MPCRGSWRRQQRGSSGSGRPAGSSPSRPSRTRSRSWPGTVRILLVGQTVSVAVGWFGFILIMVGRTGWDLVVYALSFLIDLAVAFALSPHLGAKGAAIAQATTMVASNAGRLYLVWRFVHIQPFSRHYARLAIPASITAAVMVATHLALHARAWPVDLAGTAVLGGAVYIAALLLTGLAPAERAAIG